MPGLGIYFNFSRASGTGDLIREKGRRLLHCLYKDLQEGVTLTAAYHDQLDWMYVRYVYPVISCPSLATFLQMSQHHFRSSLGIEVTIEADLCNFCADQWFEYCAIGINRMSLFFSPQRSVRTFLRRLSKFLHEVPSPNLDIDLSGWSLSNTLSTVLSELIDVKITHITLPLFQNESANNRFRRQLKAGGYLHYGAYAFAQPGYEAVHLKKCWSFEDYLGVGYGAVGKFTLPTGGVYLSKKFTFTSLYEMYGTKIAKKMSPRSAARAYWLQAFQRCTPFQVCPDQFSSATGADFVRYGQKQLRPLLDRAWVGYSNEGYYITESGRTHWLEWYPAFLSAAA